MLEPDPGVGAGAGVPAPVPVPLPPVFEVPDGIVKLPDVIRLPTMPSPLLLPRSTTMCLPLTDAKMEAEQRAKSFIEGERGIWNAQRGVCAYGEVS